MTRTVTFSFSRNTSPGDVTQSMKLVVTDAGGVVVNTSNLSPAATTQAVTLAVANGYAATLTSYAGQFNQGQPCLHPAVQAFDVPPPPIPTPGDPTLDAPVIS